MAKWLINKGIKNILGIFLITIVGGMGIVFSVLSIEWFNSGFIKDYSVVITAISVGIITMISTITVTFYLIKNETVYKLSLTILSLITIIVFGVYILNITGFWEKVKSVEDLRKYVSSFQNWAIFVFILIQFLQVVVLPIPSFVTVGAGVLLFGAFYGAIYSVIGIIIGSITAYFIGKIFGIKIVSWIVGEKSLKKWLNKLKGKDKILLTFMFLFPFFPDDILCFVAGITMPNTLFFICMIVIVRLITVFTSSYSLNNSIIPYDTWWGIAIWIALFVLTILLTIWIYKHGENLKEKLSNLRKKLFKKR